MIAQLLLYNIFLVCKVKLCIFLVLVVISFHFEYYIEERCDFMLKWIGRIVFVMVVSLLSLQVYSYATHTKMQLYYAEEVAPYRNDSSVYLKGINTLMGINYYRSYPLLYEFIDASGDYQITLRVYAIGITSNNVQYDGLMIFVNNVTILHEDQKIHNPAIRITVELDQDTLVVKDEFTNSGNIIYNPDEPFAFFNVPVLFLFDAEKYLKVVDEDVFANLTKIVVEYSNGSKDSDNNLIFSDIPLLIASTSPSNESSHNKDASFSINVTNYRLRDQFANSQPNDAEIASFNLVSDRGSFAPYNWSVWRIMIIYVLAVVFITYFLFFHKLVREHYRDKSYLRDKGNNQAVEAEPLFKDSEPDNKK